MKSKTTIHNVLNILPDWLVISFWALWIGRTYLDMGLNMWPSHGQEYIMSLQNQYNWMNLLKCGTCFFWNGLTNGGAPSFVDTHGAWLHPISFFATFYAGVFNSGKVMVIASLIMAGIGQWWLGRVLGLSRITRLWMALMFVASGALTGRVEIGTIPLVLSTAACSLVFAPVLGLMLHAGKATKITLGITIGLAALSGQGYLQIGLLISLLPVILILLIERRQDGKIRIKPVWRDLILAVILGAMIAAPLLIPAIHISPIMKKYNDPYFMGGQPFLFNFINLVINDPVYYRSPSFGKLPYPYLNNNYIGWVPVIFSILAIILAPRKNRKATLAMIAGIVFVYLCSSKILFKWLGLLLYPDFFSGIRFPGPIQGLAVPLVLALAGIGADELFKREWIQGIFAWLKASLQFGKIKMVVQWIIITLVMFFALKSVADFSKEWLYLSKLDMSADILLQSMKTRDAQWVQPPYVEYNWLRYAAENGMKIANYYRPWRIDGEDVPGAYLEMSEVKEDTNLPEYKTSIDRYVILERPANLYASITNGEQQDACTASSLGGVIDVRCNSDINGLLIVKERALSGWTASRDGQKITILSSGWLTVDALVGEHTYAFRYQPWDAPLGILLASLAWIGALIYLIITSTRKNHNQNGFEFESKAATIGNLN